jgi:flagellar protein FlbT
MGLKVVLKDKERIIINGAVIAAQGRVSLEIENRAVILRGKEFMAEEEATTPARQLYHATMLAYIDSDNRPRHQDDIVARVAAVMAAQHTLEVAALCVSFAQKAASEEYYQALADCRQLMALEDAAAAAA